ncbi:MAG: hypothetical protein R6W66_01855 [Pelovirga sp.]
MTDQQQEPMSEASVSVLLQAAGARVRSRAGRSEHYGSPRDFSFEVKGVFANGLALQITARQYNYRDPWEVSGRVNDLVDASLLYGGNYSALPRGYRHFQGRDTEENLDSAQLQTLIGEVSAINPKLFTLQQLTGDL